MTEVPLNVSRKGRLAPGALCVEVAERVTCGELVDLLVDEGWGRKGAWRLVERWNGCERRLPAGEQLVKAVERWRSGEGYVCLKGEEVTGRGEKGRRRKGRRGYLTGVITGRKLSRLCRDLKSLSISLSTQASTLWLQRLAQRQPLVVPAVQSPLAPFRERLAELRDTNLQISVEISELNIHAGGLSGQLHVLREEEGDLSEGVRGVEEDVRERRRERGRECRRRLADLQAEAIQLRRELETQNKLNSAQRSQLEAQREALEERRREISEGNELEDGGVTESCDSHMTHMVVSPDTVEEVSVVAMAPQTAGDLADSPPSSPQSEQLSHTPSSSTCKKRALFEARTRQHREEEAEEFRRQREEERRGQREQKWRGQVEEGRRQASLREEGKGSGRIAKQLQFTSQTPEGTEPATLLPSELIREGQRLLATPPSDSQWYLGEGEESPELSYRDKIERVLGGVTKDRGHLHGNEQASLSGMGGNFFSEVMSSVERRQSVSMPRGEGVVMGTEGKKVRFSPEAILLPAALEGDLDTVQLCVEQLGSPDQTSHKGATCLHNAVCSGHQPTLDYLVESGCDVNAQDDDGWTPLHCAIAYSNSSAISCLLSHGACLWLRTEEGDLAVDLGDREMVAQREQRRTEEGDLAVDLGDREMVAQREQRRTEEGDLAVDLGDREMVAQREQGSPSAAQHSLILLENAHREIGVANGGVVYALYSRRAADSDELGVCEGERLVVLRRIVGGGEGGEGEGWWEVESGAGDRGLVPCTYLGRTPRQRLAIDL